MNKIHCHVRIRHNKKNVSLQDYSQIRNNREKGFSNHKVSHHTTLIAVLFQLISHYLENVEKPPKFRRRSGSMHCSSKPSNKSIKLVTQRRQRTGECGTYLKWNRRGCQSQCRLQAERNKRRVAAT